MSKGPVAAIGRARYAWHFFTGRLLASKIEKDVRVHGVGGNIDMSVDRHHEFFLADASGEERAFRMTNFDFPSRVGQTLSVMWAIREGAKSGLYMAVYNHNTKELHTIGAKELAATFHWTVSGLSALIVIAASVLTGMQFGWMWGVGLLVLVIVVGHTLAKLRFKRTGRELLNGTAFRELCEQLTQVRPLPE